MSALAELRPPIPDYIVISEELDRLQYPTEPPVCVDTESFYRRLVQNSRLVGNNFYHPISDIEVPVASFVSQPLVDQRTRKRLLEQQQLVLMMNPLGQYEELPEEYRTRNFVSRTSNGLYFAGSVHRDLSCSPLRWVSGFKYIRVPEHPFGQNMQEILDYYFLLVSDKV